MPLKDKIYLIGFMGSGKSTTGRRLAAGLGWYFIDLDRKIEEETGLRIPELFSRYGEAGFRETETRVLRALRPLSGTVVSTGGGAPCFNDNMKFMLETGLTIYLKLTPAQLKKRLEASRTERPLLKGVSRENLLDFVSGKLSEREQWYAMAEMTIDGTFTDYPSLVTMIRQHFDR